MSAQLAEALAKVADLHTQLAEAYTELSGHFDAQSAKSGKAGGDGATGKVSGSGNKASVGSKGAKPAAVNDDLPEPTSAAGGKGGKAAAKTAPAKGKKKVTEDDVRAVAKQLIDADRKDEVLEVFGEFGAGTLKDLDEEHYGECKAKLEALLEGGSEDDGPADDDDLLG